MDSHAGPPPTDQLIGQTIGNYLVTQKLGEGGMGSVYLAEHPTIGKKVALKVLHQEYSSNQEVTQRFFNEAKAVNDIGHPNIVDIVDYGVLQGVNGRDQLVYFFMEYLAGMTVSQLIKNEAPLPPERALGLALQVADALAASHKCGIVHRDLKPDNIILIERRRERDFVKLLDFGIAKLTGDANSAGYNRTRTGIVMGTPAYMSPEQCDGKGLVDHRTDIYALGILLYEMLVGRVPFVGDGYGEILVQHLTQTPVPPSQYRMLPPHVEVVVLKALEKRPDMRYPTMEEFMRAMADPVGYVEAHGGVGAFLQRQLMPSSAPVELPSIRLTPAPLGMGSHHGTPSPGMMMSPVPGGPPSVITGPGVAQAQTLAPAPQKSRAGFWIAGVIVIAASVGGIMWVLNSQKRLKQAGTGSDSGSAISMTVVPAGSGSGSAVTIPGTVDVTLTSTPPGAEVAVDGADQKCATPCTLHLKPDVTPSMVTYRLDGYIQQSRQIVLDKGNQTDAVTLVKKEDAGSAVGSAGSAGSAAPLTGSAGGVGSAGSAAPLTGSGGGSASATPNTGHTTTPVPNTGHTTTPVPNTGHTTTPVPNTGHTTTPNTGHTTTPTGKGSAHHDSDGTIKPGDI